MGAPISMTMPALLLMTLAAVLPAQVGGVQLPPPPRGFAADAADVVVDAAGVLPRAAVDAIDRIAFDVHAKSGGEIAVVTIPDIGQREPSDIALQIGRAWGVGSGAAVGNRQRNTGVVILVVPKETSSDGRGRCWISTGRGSEGFLIDSDVAAFCREATPFFIQRDYGSAMQLLTLRVAERFAREFSFALDTTVTPQGLTRSTGARRNERGFPPVLLLLVFIIILIVLSSAARRGRRVGVLPLILPMGGRRHHHGGWGGWGGGGFGGGGGGGGFGGFGGGGGFSGGGGGSNW